tara:strand:+ start:620 stop:1576 length:957 start_codon:yes stop_codon:yes gene_type:complete
MIVVTGGAGFIGSNLVNHLIKKQYAICSVDWHNKKNDVYFSNKDFQKVNPKDLNVFLANNLNQIKVVLHLGAITSTTEKNLELIIKNNIDLSLKLWNWCAANKKRFIYASSAATYGNGLNGFNDDSNDKNLSNLVPLNLYGWSKHLIDRIIWTEKSKFPAQCVGLKFFNVYGPNEYHKKDMKSIILKIYEKIQSNQTIKLFKSHNPSFKDGEQLRDFVYVKDVIKVIDWLIKKPKINGLFNVGSSIPRSFNDLATCVYRNCNKKKKIQYTPTPFSIRNQYQYFTKANIKRLREVGYNKSFLSLEEGINDYISNYLRKI